jgi:hypothetical protein
MRQMVNTIHRPPGGNRLPANLETGPDERVAPLGGVFFSGRLFPRVVPAPRCADVEWNPPFCDSHASGRSHCDGTLLSPAPAGLLFGTPSHLTIALVPDTEAVGSSTQTCAPSASPAPYPDLPEIADMVGVQMRGEIGRYILMWNRCCSRCRSRGG